MPRSTARRHAFFVLLALAAASCGRRAEPRLTDQGIDPAREIVRRTFEDRVQTIDAALPLAVSVDTTMTGADGHIHCTGWFSSGLPVRIDIEVVDAGKPPSNERYYFDEESRLMAVVSDFISEERGRHHIVARRVFDPAGRPLAGEIERDGVVLPRTDRALWAANAGGDLSMANDHREMLTRILRRSERGSTRRASSR